MINYLDLIFCPDNIEYELNCSECLLTSEDTHYQTLTFEIKCIMYYILDVLALQVYRDLTLVVVVDLACLTGLTTLNIMAISRLGIADSLECLETTWDFSVSTAYE